MKKLFILLLLLIPAHYQANLLEDNVRNHFEQVIEAVFDQVSSDMEDTLVDATNSCDVTATITCTVDKNGENCEDFVVPLKDCQQEAMTFVFEYCSHEVVPIELFRGRTENVDMKNLPKGSMAYINAEPVEISFEDMPPGKCWTVVEKRKVNTCGKMINSSIKIEGWRGNSNIGDYCFAWEFYRQFFKRPDFPQPSTSCDVEGDVSCVVKRTGQECENLKVSYDQCGKEEIVFTFDYCNNEPEFAIILREGNTDGNIDMNNLPPGSMAWIHTEPVRMNMDNLVPGQCRTMVRTRYVDTCWDTIDASLKLEGWLESPILGSYCYLWSFYRAHIERPSGSCSIDAEVSCRVADSGERCEDLVIPIETCKQEEMIFTFEYCNENVDDTLLLRGGNPYQVSDMRNLPVGTMAFINLDPVNIDFKDLGPRECKAFSRTRMVNTCWDTIDASLKIEGWREYGGDYCYAWNFYRTLIKRPKLSSCQVRAEVSCSVDSTGVPCDQLIAPVETCGIEMMRFSFVYCSDEAVEFIYLRRGNTDTNIDMDNLPPGTMAFVHTVPQDLDLDDLAPGQCKTITVTREVNTCWDTIDASLKIEGWRGDGDNGDYCFAWDFYRQPVKRQINAPTIAPSNQSSSCNASAQVTCYVDRTGMPCEDLIVPLSDCGKEALTFTFEYCNHEASSIIDLFSGDTSGNIDMHNLPSGTMAFVFKRPVTLNFRELFPGECMTIVEKRDVTTCRPSIEASLKVEGWRESRNAGDYCFAWDFYKTTIQRNDFSPTRSPTTSCRVDATVSCLVDRLNAPCENLVVPLEECGEEKMTFTFEYCSSEVLEDINLRLGDTSGEVDMNNLPIGSMAFVHTDSVPISVSHLPPGFCWSETITRFVNTCRPNIDASLKLEGWRGDGEVGDFCFAWDFYRSTIRRLNLEFPTASPTVAPTLSFQPTTNYCGIPKDQQRTKISSIIDSVSLKSDLQNPNSPQSKARNWMLFEDTFDSFCPPPCNRERKDGGIIQRYTMAVFYFATGGDATWQSCGRNSQQSCSPQLTLFESDPIEIVTGDETWLSSVSECIWGGLACREDTQCIDRIEFGEFLHI
jgi:hypothetical protein